MRLSRAATYAIYGSVYIAAATGGGGDGGDGGRVSVSVIHQACGIPEQHLAKVLGVLAKAGILLSVRGPGGGFQLARPASSIDLLQIVHAVDGPVSPSNPLLSCEVAQVVDPVVHRGGALMEGVLAATTLETLALQLRPVLVAPDPSISE